MRTFLKLAVVAVVASTLAGCVLVGDRLDQARARFGTAPVWFYNNSAGYQAPSPQQSVMDSKTVVAIAISGGGSRSAMFSAAVLEQLAAIPDPRTGRSLLDSVDAVSGVSGGSLSAAYFGLYKPNTFSGDPAASAAFFNQFKINMALDLVMRSTQHYLSHPWEGALKYYSRYRWTETLGNTIDQYLFRGSTFQTLHDREASGESPLIIIPAANLDTGQKFLFTNLKVEPNFNVDSQSLLSAVGRNASANDKPLYNVLASAVSQPLYRVQGFDTINSNICDFKLAHAITASSAYPIIPGPATLFDYARNGYLHLADGGVNDNWGVDALVQLYLNRYASGKARRLVIINIDATGSGRQYNKSGDPDGYMGAISYGSQALGFQAARGATLTASVLGNMQSITVIPVALRKAPCSADLDGVNISYRIQVPDQQRVLQAAAELTPAIAPLIQQALGGNR